MKKDVYKKSGVDINKANNLIQWLSDISKQKPQTVSAKCTNPYGHALNHIGGFSGLFKLELKKFKNPILFASTDGVGTKLLLAIQYKSLHTIGIDLVAMCVNDLYCVGASPLFFLDYYATGSLNARQFKDILTSIKTGLSLCRSVLLGGETAEMPGLYKDQDLDLAGFVVGVVDRSNILGKDNVKEDDILYAFESSGFHSNGYSLIRQWLVHNNSYNKKLISKLLVPTVIYWQIPQLLENVHYTKTIHAIAHITGGGISGNLCRVIPDNMCALLHRLSIPTPLWMKNFILQNTSDLDSVEHVFNMGVGMICVVNKHRLGVFEKESKKLGLNPIKIGQIVQRDKQHKSSVIYQ